MSEFPACLPTSKHALEVRAGSRQDNAVGAELGGSDVDHYVAQLFLLP